MYKNQRFAAQVGWRKPSRNKKTYSFNPKFRGEGGASETYLKKNR
jgi:hypothetical protein